MTLGLKQDFRYLFLGYYQVKPPAKTDHFRAIQC